MITTIELKLESSYSEVFRKTQASKCFDEVLLSQSRSLFDVNHSGDIFTPKHLEVNALVGGLEFSNKLKELAMAVQRKVDEIIQTNQRYWVHPCNLGIEYIVTKWPEQPPLSNDIELDFISKLKLLNLEQFLLKIKGYQINPDGCLVLRGYEGGHIFQTRDSLREKLAWLPSRQSGWAHIPLGRILCNVSPATHQKLVSECEKSFDSLFHEESICDIHYVHEKQWYMEKHSKVETIKLR
jgi:hypothetical protein